MDVMTKIVVSLCYIYMYDNLFVKKYFHFNILNNISVHQQIVVSFYRKNDDLTQKITIYVWFFAGL